MRHVLPSILLLPLWFPLPGCAGPETAMAPAPFVHVVFFKTKGESPDKAAAEIVKDIDSMLASLPTVKAIRVGRPAPTATRPVVDANYDVGLFLLFEDQKGLQEYLDHPRHVEFAKKHDTVCDVRVFDFTPKP